MQQTTPNNNQIQVISSSGSALLDPTNLQALVDKCTNQEFRVEYKDEKKVRHHCHNCHRHKLEERDEYKSSLMTRFG